MVFPSVEDVNVVAVDGAREVTIDGEEVREAAEDDEALGVGSSKHFYETIQVRAGGDQKNTHLL